MSRIILNATEQRLAQYVGRCRAQVNRAGGVRDQQCSHRMTGEEVDVEGAGAEIALAKLLNVYPDLSLEPRKGGADLLWGVLRVDAKTTRYPQGQLLATMYKTRGGVDVYALLVGPFPTYELKGFCSEAQLFDVERITDLGRGPTRAVPQADLVTLPVRDQRLAPDTDAG